MSGIYLPRWLGDFVGANVVKKNIIYQHGAYGISAFLAEDMNIVEIQFAFIGTIHMSFIHVLLESRDWLLDIRDSLLGTNT